MSHFLILWHPERRISCRVVRTWQWNVSVKCQSYISTVTVSQCLRFQQEKVCSSVLNWHSIWQQCFHFVNLTGGWWGETKHGPWRTGTYCHSVAFRVLWRRQEELFERVFPPHLLAGRQRQPSWLANSQSVSLTSRKRVSMLMVLDHLVEQWLRRNHILLKNHCKFGGVSKYPYQSSCFVQQAVYTGFLVGGALQIALVQGPLVYRFWKIWN